MIVSPYMDRKVPLVTKLQESFISSLVGTLCKAYETSGLMPGVLVDEPHQHSQATGKFIYSKRFMSIGQYLTLFLVLDDPSETSITTTTTKKVFYSEILSNFKSNYEMWCEKLRQEQTVQKNDSKQEKTSCDFVFFTHTHTMQQKSGKKSEYK